MWTKLLWPLALVYILAVKLRCFLYSLGVIKSHAFKVPVVSVGNIVMGGAGKTPCIQSLVELLQKQDKKVAVVYRGYKKKSKQKILEVDIKDKAEECGDEAYLVKFLYPSVKVFVGANRSEVIEKLRQTYPEVDVILLDDAFQHLAVKRDLNLLLIDASEKISSYKALPVGRMREPWSSVVRADEIILSKVNMQSESLEYPLGQLKKYRKKVDHSFSYELNGFVLFNDWLNKDFSNLKAFENNEPITFISGLAKPRQLALEIEKKLDREVYKIFKSDHYAFQLEDFSDLCGKIIVSEKDAVKIKDIDIDKESIFVARSEIIWNDKGYGIDKSLRSLFG